MSADNNILDFNGLSKYHSKIKNTLSAKVGYIRVVGNNEQYFADSESADLYDTGLDQYTNLLLGSVPLPEGGGGGGGYLSGAVINVITPMYNAVKLGSKGHTVKFSVDILNNQGQSTGEQIDLRIITTHNANTQTQKINARAGQVLTVSVDDYLKEGTNTISIKITGKTSGSNTMVAVTYDVVNLVLEDYYEAAQYVDMREGSAILQVPYFISGYGTKKMEWYIDGEAVPFVKEDDEIVEFSSERIKYIEVSNLNQGRHSLQYRAYTNVNGESFYTDTMYHDLLVYVGTDTATMVGASAVIPSDKGIVAEGEALTLYGMEQFVPYYLKFYSYSPITAETEISVMVDGENVGDVKSKNNTINILSYTPTTSGSKRVSFKIQDVEVYSFPIEVIPTSLNLEEITNALVLDFSGNGKSNTSTDKDSWSYGNYTGTFTGFNWNENSGWKDNRLVISNGCSFEIDYAPLGGTPTDTGKSIEIEFMVNNVNDDDAVICDMRDEDGTGILITATKALLQSQNGVLIETEFKDNELIRLGFVLHRSENVTRKNLSFIYCNGIASRCINRSSLDGYQCNKNIKFVGSEGATVELKAVRIYDTALNDDQLWNNFTLYRDTIEEMLDVYSRNDIYEDGTYVMSIDKLGRRLPYMMVTGDIPVLENTTDKNEQITVDIEYVNAQEPELNFTMEGAAMRPQGTSSMGYPKKNFRIYTQELPGTVLRDSNGNEVVDKLYAFRRGAQPVNCWCLKADYAESSGTHNTAIARMWGNALKNVNIELDGKKEYVCQTQAQKAAAANNYPYDVRTTIDGFPILLFYRKSKQDSPIFIGKYNFNNDKSTESVFGFTGIPGFDNSRMQCWEILNNGNSLALFTSSEGFDEGWKEAFESRYPDTKSPNTTDLKNFCQWMSNVSKENFITEKHQHMNLWMMAAYYCYLMRHAGADQFVKNAMLTSEDGEHFYFILYDNDTINGLINTGHLKIKPTDDRNSIGEDGEHLFAGHDSRLWNMLEDDEEFMQMVSQIDNALYTAGISYRNAIKEFDEEQCAKWCERIYNQDAQYKYVGPYTNDNVNNLFMLQGSRALHRRWFLARRFGIYDAKFVSGTYKSQSIEIKCINDTVAGQVFTIKAGYPLHYGYGINNVPREFGIYLDRGESYSFVTKEKLNLGDPLRIYAAHYISELDFSAMTDRLSVANIGGVYDEALGTSLTRLIIGSPEKENNGLANISGIEKAEKLEYIDIRNMKAMTDLTLPTAKNLKEVHAFGSKLTSVSLASGAPVTLLELPATMKAIELSNLPLLTKEGVVLEGSIGNVDTLIVSGCPNLSNDFQFIQDWIESHSIAGTSKCYLSMTDVDWNIPIQKAIEIKTALGDRMNLKGVITVTGTITLQEVRTLTSLYGEHCFEEGSELYIRVESAALFADGAETVTAGTSTQMKYYLFGGKAAKVYWTIQSGGNEYTSISENGLLSVSEECADIASLVVRVQVVLDTNETLTATHTTSVKALVFPNKSTTTIVGASKFEDTDELEYTVELGNVEPTAEYTVDWKLNYESTGLVVEIISQSKNGCVIRKVSEATSVPAQTITLSAEFKTNKGVSLFVKQKEILYTNGLVAETDEGICLLLHTAKLIANKGYITREEAAVITSSQLKSAIHNGAYSDQKKVKSFEGFRFFTSVNAILRSTFSSLTIDTLKCPDSVTEIDGGALNQATVEHLYLPNISTRLRVGNFEAKVLSNVHFVKEEDIYKLEYSSADPWWTDKVYNLYVGEDKIDRLVVPESVTTIRRGMFAGMNAEVILHPFITSVEKYAFYNYPKEIKLSFPSITSFGDYVFSNSSITGLEIGEAIKDVPDLLLDSCKKLKEVSLRASYKYNLSASLESLYIGHNVSLEPKYEYSLPLGTCGSIKHFSVEDGNPWYSLGDGGKILIKNGNTLVKASCAEEIVLPEAIKTIGPYAFSCIKSLKSFTIPDTITSIGRDAFSESGIEHIEIPSSVRIMGTGLCSKCASLLTAVVRTSIVPTSCFYNCENLKSVTLNNVTEIQKDAFEYSSIETIEIPDSVVTIVEEAFDSCTKLREVTFGDGCLLQSIGNKGFFNCMFLEEIVIPKHVSNIGNSAFGYCDRLSNIICHPTTAPTLGTEVFKNVGSKSTADKVLSIYQGATGYDTGQWLDPLLNPDSCGFTLNYMPVPEFEGGSWITIDQSITDPSTMISGDVNGEHIQLIRNNSHRYLGKYTSEGTMTVCQLDDNDSNKYHDGSAAVLTGNEGDVFVKLPQFYYKCREASTDVWEIGFYCGTETPDSNWIKWDTNALIGAYEAYSEGENLYSRSGVASSKNISQENSKVYARNRGNGFRIVDWQMHCVMAILFYAQYGHTNCQDKIGKGTSSQKPCGGTDTCGMNDTKGESPVDGLNDAGADGNAQSINFWGLENWWGNKKEWIDNVVVNNKEWKITELDGTVRTPGISSASSGDITKMMFGDNCDLIPTAAKGSSTTGFCDFCSQSSDSSRVVARSGSGSSSSGGVVNLDDNQDSSYVDTSYGSRLAFRGSVAIESNPNTFKSLTALS